MRLIIGADEPGFPLKEAIKAHLTKKGVEFTDVGTQDLAHIRPFYQVAPVAGKMISGGEADIGILVCGTGMGMAQVANKYNGVLAACVESVYAARMCRVVNNSNVLCMGARILGTAMALEMVDVFLETGHTEGQPPERQAFLKNAYDEVLRIQQEIYS